VIGVSAIVLAAGRSSRMGRPKLLLSIHGRTVIERIVRALGAAGIEDVVVVTGHHGDDIEVRLLGLRCRCVRNPEPKDEDMLGSLRVGLLALGSCRAALLALGDQPAIEAPVIEALIRAWHESGASFVRPVHQGRRGHPVLLARALFPAILDAPPGATLRDVLARHQGRDVDVATDSVLMDIDTPEDWERVRER
jgi:molybdenum cofactor cytidylyltransferase